MGNGASRGRLSMPFNWWLGVHFALGTRRMGVNGIRRVRFDSLFTRPLFGFGWRLAWRPWRWRAAWRVVRLRISIAGLD
ncbi:MAG: hypothetical protein A2638_05980 [Nitrospirae bacterium RIFCSPHIGHO2_01_FULL_66_17]|nr:MAG: hypothetical protein A2638_05980 [Nitrospirae bacterium RIFCSPHIGHO2_01_FULL_66_17]